MNHIGERGPCHYQGVHPAPPVTGVAASSAAGEVPDLKGTRGGGTSGRYVKVVGTRGRAKGHVRRVRKKGRR